MYQHRPKKHLLLYLRRQHQQVHELRDLPLDTRPNRANPAIDSTSPRSRMPACGPFSLNVSH